MGSILALEKRTLNWTSLVRTQSFENILFQASIASKSCSFKALQTLVNFEKFPKMVTLLILDSW